MMLAKGPPNCIADGGRRIPRWQRLHPLGDGGSSLFPGFLVPSAPSSGHCRERLAIRTGNYTRVPMDTPGAYQLVDEETGEKVIVWGGADDGLDSPVPPEEVLTWKPAEEATSTLGGGGDGMPRRRTAGTAGNFGKLKAQKVKALIRSKKTPISDDDDDDEDESMPQELEVRMRKGNELVRRKRIQSPQINVENDGSNYGGEEDYETNLKSRFLDVLRKGTNDDESATGASSVKGWRNVQSSTAWRASVQPAVPLKKKDRNSSNYDARFFSRKSFKDLGCSDEMVECLRKQQFLRPSHIQAMTYPHLLDRRSCIISDQSGSGKTLAYLAPTIQRLRQEELGGLSKSSSRSPRAIILVPTAELATQVLNNCRSIARSGFPFRSMIATGGFRQKTQLESLEQDLDVLIATPGRFIYLFQEGFLKLNNLKW